jgi:excisionase family DNA binding protein
MLTVKEAAALLRVSTATVYKLCERGQLQHLRVGNAIRLPAAAVERALAAADSSRE